MAKSNFSSAFIPGLVLGLVVGAFAGVFLSSLSLPAVKDSPKMGGPTMRPITPRDESPADEPASAIDQGSTPKAPEGAAAPVGDPAKTPDAGTESKTPSGNPEVKPPTNNPAPPTNTPATDPKLVK